MPLYLRNDSGGPIARSVAEVPQPLEAMAIKPAPTDPPTRYRVDEIPLHEYYQFILRILIKILPKLWVNALFEQVVADRRRPGTTVASTILLAG